MSIPVDIYKMLEDIVGPEYISDKEYVLAAYRHTGPGGRGPQPGPGAVVLPASAEEGFHGSITHVSP